jgi:hypothetical protein
MAPAPRKWDEVREGSVLLVNLSQSTVAINSCLFEVIPNAFPWRDLPVHASVIRQHRQIPVSLSASSGRRGALQFALCLTCAGPGRIHVPANVTNNWCRAVPLVLAWKAFDDECKARDLQLA